MTESTAATAKPTGGAERVRVAVHAFDGVTRLGLTRSLDRRDDLLLVPRPTSAQVVVLAVDALSREAVCWLREAASAPGPLVVLVTANPLDERDLLTALECRVVAVLPRKAATPDHLARSALSAAKGGGELPPALLGTLLKYVERLRRELAECGAPSSVLSAREVEVLRLVAEGWNTSEIASKMALSERTVKGLVTSLTGKLDLKNRSHAVAYAARVGII
ncbi:response regulator transcription factor [Actinosynnema sp. CA-299493]